MAVMKTNSTEGTCEWHLIALSTNIFSDAEIRAKALDPP